MKETYSEHIIPPNPYIDFAHEMSIEIPRGSCKDSETESPEFGGDLRLKIVVRVLYEKAKVELMSNCQDARVLPATTL